MRYQIFVNGHVLMEVMYVSDVSWFLRERRSLGDTVHVVNKMTGQRWENETAEEIVNELCFS